MQNEMERTYDGCFKRFNKIGLELQEDRIGIPREKCMLGRRKTERSKLSRVEKNARLAGVSLHFLAVLFRE